MYVAKVTADGEHLFSRAFSHTALPSSVAVGPTGRVAVVGRFSGRLDFGDSSVTTDDDESDLFVVKLRADGTDLWSRQISGSASVSMGEVAIDGGGDVIVTG